MPIQDERYYSYRRRWTEGSVSTCFAWPSNESTTITKVAQNVGEQVTTESKLPNWRYRISHGLSATTTFEAETSELTFVRGSIFLGKWCNAVQRFGFFTQEGDLFNGATVVWDRPPAPIATIDPQVRDEALTRAIQDARSKQTHFRGGNFLAELGDTIRGLRNPVKGFRGLLDAYHRNARKRVKNAVGRRNLPRTNEDWRNLEKGAPDVSRAAQRALSDSWLEANFGWQPLLSDAVDAYTALRRLSAKVPLSRFYGTSSRETAPTYASGQTQHDITFMNFTARTSQRFHCTFYGAVKVEVDEPSSSVIEEMGVRARDFIPAVWEAVPYSFLVDYFVNIGEILETVCFPRSDLAWVSRTFRNHSIRSSERVAIVEPSSPAYPQSNSDKVFAFQSPRIEWNRKRVRRQEYFGSLVPGVRFEIPGSRNWKKYCNLAALARLRTL